MIPIIATILQLIVFTVYTYIIIKKFGFLDSISHSTYEWDGEKKYYFMWMCWILAFLNVFQDMGVYGFFTTAGLVFTGITVDWLDDEIGYWVHTIGALTTILIPFIGMWALYGIFIPFGIFGLLAVATYYLLIKPVLWIEVQAFALILISYTLRWL